MAATVQLPVTLEIDEIDQEFLANATDEAARMPADLGAQTLRKHHNVATGHFIAALQVKFWINIY